jgi:2-oxoglutarate ferredoxin oxidoreductase subunit beta
MGTVERPINPISFALSSGATFVARSVDVYAKHLMEIFQRAARHRGAAFIEVLQNCTVFNDGAWTDVTEKDVREDTNVVLEHGKPLIFGKSRECGLRLNGLQAEVVKLGTNGVTEKDLIVHDETSPHAAHAFLLSRLVPPAFPMPLGIFRSVEYPSYERSVHDQVAQAKRNKGTGDLHKLLTEGDTWEVKG